MDILLAEKPSAAKAIAKALGNVETKRYNKRVPFYIVDNDKFVCSAVGHLFTLHPTITERGIFPKWNFQWTSIWTVNRKAYYAKDYYECLQWLISKYNFDRFLISTDFDIEGTVIGFITFLSLKVPLEKIYRMKMHSLAKQDVIKAYNNLEPPDVSWFNAGITRHETDILYGINLTEAFSKAISLHRKRRKTLSLGRVQTPTLRFVVERENEIRNFKPQPYWNIFLYFSHNNVIYKAEHVKGDIFDYSIVQQILNKCKESKQAVVEQFTKEQKQREAPTLFNLPLLQQEAFYKLGFQPHFTDVVAQSLYQQALISYPRTGSTAIWTGVPYKRILENLQKQIVYKDIVEEIEQQNYAPHKHGVSDGAHSALYPTGEPNEPKTDAERKLLELITLRFLSVFYPSLVQEHSHLTINVNGELFRISGVKTVDEGWTRVYKYIKPEQHIIPEIQPNTILEIDKIESVEKQTKPPPRYNNASLISEMEKAGIGTKATRAEIVKLLFRRGYIYYEKDIGIKPTRLGEKIVEISQKYCPIIIDIALTSQLEQSLDLIMENKTKRETVLNNVRQNITQILNDISHNLDNIGKELVSTI